MTSSSVDISAPAVESADRRRQLQQAFIDKRGYWSPVWAGLLEADPEFFATYLEFSSLPWNYGPLEPKFKELIYITVDAAATHLFVPGIRVHVQRALDLGATRAEIMEVLELTATLGIHAANIGVPILVEELERRGEHVDHDWTVRQLEIKAEFEHKRGYWHEFWEDMLALDPEFFATYTEFSSVPWISGPLPPKIKELVYTAFDVSATHLYTSGLRQHIRNALGYGATREEVMEVIELASVIGIHAANVGVPILLEELESRENGSDA